MNKRVLIPIIITCLFLCFQAEAHQPRIVSGPTTEINNPDVSQAFYGELKGRPAHFTIDSKNSFPLYVGLLSPRVKEADKDFSVIVKRDDAVILGLNGMEYEWEPFYEEFGGDYYFRGPEEKLMVGPGLYNLEVFSPDNQGKYVLVVGEKEEFPPREIINTIAILPKLKKDFFERSPFAAFFNLSGLFLLIFFLIIIGTVFIIKKMIKRNRGD